MMSLKRMATRVQIPIEEYLHTSFEPDREYLDGEVLERMWKTTRTPKPSGGCA